MVVFLFFFCNKKFIVTGLFHKGIAMSGSVLNNWVLMEKPLDKARKLAFLVGCPTESSAELKHCMKTKSARQILKNIIHFQVKNNYYLTIHNICCFNPL